MKLRRVYIDTSVIGGCLDEEFAPWSNGLVEDFRQGLYVPVVSEVVVAALEPAPAEVREKYNEVRAWAEIVEVTEEAIALAEMYQARGILTPKFYDDGLHIALATVHALDVLVSWNFKHIVHFDKIRQFSAVNIEQGYRPIPIHSPREVTTYGTDAEE